MAMVIGQRKGPQHADFPDGNWTRPPLSTRCEPQANPTAITIFLARTSNAVVGPVPLLVGCRGQTRGSLLRRRRGSPDLWLHHE